LPHFSTNFGRFEVAFDRPEFDRTQVLVHQSNTKPIPQGYIIKTETK